MPIVQHLSNAHIAIILKHIAELKTHGSFIIPIWWTRKQRLREVESLGQVHKPGSGGIGIGTLFACTAHRTFPQQLFQQTHGSIYTPRGLPEAQDKKVALFCPLSHSADSPASFSQLPITFQLCLKLTFFPPKFLLIRSAVEYRLQNNNAKVLPLLLFHFLLA